MIEQLLQAERLLVVDQRDQARDMYARVAELDPGNAIAVVGLARCALADGDDHAAYGLAARALRIDPENDMARRMEARLAEVLAERGEPVDRSSAANGSMGATTIAPAPTPNPAGTETSGSAASAGVRRSFLDRLRGR
jgi:thioredoxin-like negative regulator of GroEL